MNTMTIASTAMTLETESPEIAVTPAKAVTSARQQKENRQRPIRNIWIENSNILCKFARNAYKNKIFCLLAISVARKRRNFVTDD